MAFLDARRFRGHHLATVARREQVGPHMVRVTLEGEDLTGFTAHGFDQWVRLFLPRTDGPTDYSRVPQGFGIAGALKYLTTGSGVRPPVRSYTIRELRPEAGELDIDFVAHGDEGIAGPWAQRARAGEQVMMIDQGRGFDPDEDASSVLLVGEESALPALLGILRDLPRSTAGTALIEIPEQADAQEHEAPEDVEVRWLPRKEPHDRPGVLALEALRELVPSDGARLQAYLAGEQALVAEGRRHLVANGVPKKRIVFTGYWKVGRAAL
ncbi:siderophore-interacting protein [Brachybacterium endophyticum]|uniref:Siderophore-interacting protein n=1 Tax=Brachybacterium endophyticum TaxID=2182385 RepID=A0A2U2RI57_9MICO|nr:siderophore-interacting protein [Brachybacterium endophyticum]PWH05464.1 siderophore-interacting protein [Brachybacterium endophyticum]